jgi:hypothetical protein
LEGVQDILGQELEHDFSPKLDGGHGGPPHR